MRQGLCVVAVLALTVVDAQVDGGHERCRRVAACRGRERESRPRKQPAPNL
jgi:hypothetical protein